MPDTVTAGSNMATESEKSYTLKGMPGNPVRDPKRAAKGGKGSVGDKALTDALIIVVAAWVLLVVLALSLRHHNV